LDLRKIRVFLGVKGVGRKGGLDSSMGGFI
jgi:hypothetical protein